MQDAGAGSDPLLEADRRRVRSRAAVYWGAGTAMALVIVAAHPPTVALGPGAGWGFVGAALLASLAFGVRLHRVQARVSDGLLLVALLTGVASVAVAQWLSGGPASPLGLAFTFFVFGAAAVLPVRLLVVYLAAVTAATVAPLVYDPQAAETSGTLVYAVSLWAIALFNVDYRRHLQAQRRALYEAERAAAAQAHTDALTGMGNRRALEVALTEWLAGRGEDDHLTVVYLDLNGFKAYNDRFGHSSGDALLRRLGQALTAVLGPADRAFRVGGDEFCVLLAGDVDPEHPAVAAVVAALAEHGLGFSIDASCGVVAIPREAADPDAALRLADARMYQDKRAERASPAREMSELLLRVIAEREPELHDHAADVVGLARAVALRLGLEGEELDVVIRAAEQHDVGKLAIPDEILRKPGPLDEGEWALMRQHTIAGERILAGTPSLRTVSRLVRSSHERWDGAGYPDGLRGEDIPLGARIIGACDAWSAMRADRPYRRALTRREALAELDRCAGSQFDPAVAHAVRAVVLDAVAAPAGV